MNGPQVFPCSPVSFALGLHKVAVWHGGLVNYGPWNVLLIYGGPEENFLPWGEVRKSTSFMGFVELLILTLLVGEEVPDPLHVDWL